MFGKLPHYFRMKRICCRITSLRPESHQDVILRQFLLSSFSALSQTCSLTVRYTPALYGFRFFLRVNLNSQTFGQQKNRCFPQLSVVHSGSPIFFPASVFPICYLVFSVLKYIYLWFFLICFVFGFSNT